MKTLAELKEMTFIPHHNCALCNTMVGWYVQSKLDNPYFDPSCDCGGSSGHYGTWEQVFKWYNMAFEKESEKDVLEAWEKEQVKIFPVKSGVHATEFNNIIKSELDQFRSDVSQKLIFLKNRISDCPSNSQLNPIRCRLESVESDLRRLFHKRAFLEMIENHKSNWIPNSKGGEPNHKE